METIYIYPKDNLENVIERPVLSIQEFKENILQHFPPYREEDYFISEVKLTYPIIDNDVLREMNDKEKVEAGYIVLADGQYLDENVVKTIEKPNNYSVWDKDEHVWKEDKVLKLQYLKDTRYEKQQAYLKFKHELEEKENEKTEFEELGFDITETEERILEIKSEMDLLKTEISKLSKEITALNKK